MSTHHSPKSLEQIAIEKYPSRCCQDPKLVIEVRQGLISSRQDVFCDNCFQQLDLRTETYFAPMNP